MKARKFIKRDRRIAGRTTGTLLCHLSLPMLGEKYEWRTLQGNPMQAVRKIRTFVERHLPKHLDLQKDASFVIQVEIRACGGGLRRNRLAKWEFGDELELVFEKASQASATLEPEEDYKSIEVEI